MKARRLGASVCISADDDLFDHRRSMRDFAAHFTQRGYTTLEIDIGPTEEKDTMKSEELMDHFEDGESPGSSFEGKCPFLFSCASRDVCG